MPRRMSLQDNHGELYMSAALLTRLGQSTTMHLFTTRPMHNAPVYAFQLFNQM